MLKINSHFLQLFLSGSISIIQPEKKIKRKKKNQISLQELQADFPAMLNTDPRAGGTRSTAHLPTNKLEMVEISGINEGFGGVGWIATSGCPKEGVAEEGDTTRWSMTVTFQDT